MKHFIAVLLLPCAVLVSPASAQSNTPLMGGSGYGAEPSQDEKDVINALALERWNYGKSNTTIDQSCIFASLTVLQRTARKEYCWKYLDDQLRAGNARIDSESRQQEEARNAQQRTDDRKEHQAMIDESTAIAARVEAGDATASNLCQGRGERFHNICMPLSNAAFIRALRAKKIQPTSCQHHFLANTKEGYGSPIAMRVSIDSEGKFGTFQGSVTQLNGKTLSINDRTNGSNAIVLIDSKTQIFKGDKVAVGLVVGGSGIQTGARQITLTSGQASTIAVIVAKCIQGF